MIKGKDYTGKWRVNGETMCFQYGQDPEACWQVKLDGDQVTATPRELHKFSEDSGVALFNYLAASLLGA